MNESGYQDELDFIIGAVRASSRRYIGRSKSDFSEKTNSVGAYDIVTKDDVDTERSLMDSIHERYPDDLFICEESSNQPLTDGRTWIIDPIDGTVNYSRGLPIYGTQLALMDGGRPVLSAIYLPAFDEMYTAVEGDVARMNGAEIHGPADRPLNQSMISLGDFSRRNQAYRDAQARFIDAMYDVVARIKIFGASCYDFAMLAAGSIDMHMRFVNNVWDYIPGLYLCERAGLQYDHALMEDKRLLIMSSDLSKCQRFYELVARDVLEG